MKKNHLKLITAGILSTTLLSVSTPAIALETPKPTTTQKNSPWGLDRIDQRLLPLDGNYSTESEAGKGVSIYIVDTGIRSTHDDFSNRVEEGWNVVNGNNDTSACGFHGNHVAGIAAGTTYGVAKSATIIPVKIVDNNCNETWESVTAGLKWVKEHHQEGTPAVVNISIAGFAKTKPTEAAELDAAASALIDEGITVVAGAGNNGDDACTISPARVPGVITVAASNRDDKPWDEGKPDWDDTSNFGSCVDIYAPGQDILSVGYASDTATHTDSGTSMASPHVAGAAAVILSRNPTLTPAQVTDEIINTATWGKLTNVRDDTVNRLLFLTTTPSAPVDVIASPGTAAGTVDVKWTDGADGGSPISLRTIYAYENGTKWNTYNIPSNYSNNTFSIGALPEGKSFTFTMAATNEIGISPESARSAPVTVPSATAPSAPSNVVASTGTTAGRATVKWTQGADGRSAITSQKIHIYEDGIKRFTANAPASATSLNISPLPEGKIYTFSVTATNVIGTSPESERSYPVKIPSAATAPDAPFNVTATPMISGDILDWDLEAGARENALTISWNEGSNNGSALTGHQFNVYEDGVLVIDIGTANGEETTFDIGGLKQGYTYTFSVNSINDIGVGPASTKSNPITIETSVPAPTNPRAYARTGSADVFWDAPADNGSVITSYEITTYNGTNVVKTVTVPASQKGVTISGLYNGTNYHFTVKAINSEGRSLASIASNAINPIAKAPNAATSLRAYARDNAADIFWIQGKENGAPLTSQIVTVYSGTTKVGTVTISETKSSVRISNLTEGREYQFTITEVNSIGSSLESAKTTIVTPY